MISCKEASTFLKKKAQIEEEYGRQMLRLAKSTSEMYSTTEGKAGLVFLVLTILFSNFPAAPSSNPGIK